MSQRLGSTLTTLILDCWSDKAVEEFNWIHILDLLEKEIARGG
jgi:hypothetical protein